ncbi:hypothetical protein [Xenorhabdus bharatensis]|uniref:hypothetical protein n=1 Tax=Xenorhabdus bharatensis TaxID=3136256 RepID=UPI0030F378A0
MENRQECGQRTANFSPFAFGYRLISHSTGDTRGHCEQKYPLNVDIINANQVSIGF